MTTAFILTGGEWDFALTGGGDPGALADKGLASLDESGAAVVGPELRLLADEYRGADAEEIEPGVEVLRGARFCMIKERYRHIPGAWKLSLFRDERALLDALDERREDADGKAAD
jgi:hypothetical protein